MRKPVIAIDGYSSTGKSSISKVIANELDLIHMDTGALYRGVTYFALKNCLEQTGEINLEKLFAQLPLIKIEFKTVDHELQIFLNDEDISQQIRDKEVSSNVSLIACQKEVRDYLMETQRSIAKEGGVILDGRDIGTVVLPDADFKFFLTASIEERTRRRYLELKSMGVNMLEEEVRENLTTRDKIDSEREVAPLKKAEDAIIIDNTTLTKMETILLIKSYIHPI
ncbi:(d)CMP kinase [Chryseobacterium sp. MP_3.2]|uniref:(d)CMP kinase n=1 Tax=Chryseobacterium sp. MP_3.2 TaxID=3071712 RepID=UPI002E0C1CFA|nr:cytidylate kinase [Chryseobacterium sp. MP_3.2]